MQKKATLWLHKSCPILLDFGFLLYMSSFGTCFLNFTESFSVGQSSPLAFPFEAKSQLASSHQSDLAIYAG